MYAPKLMSVHNHSPIARVLQVSAASTDVGVRSKPAFADDDGREAVQGFELRVGKRSSFA
jgi:hypothetical protein